ncbi:MAG TPA: DUF554 domain-containing protein, partial [Anaerolineales bacterium]|nr:DUF554 domain-containing protein [Anaerolineales bacterium]
MTGTLINVAAILIGGSLGLLFGARLPERLKSTVVAGMGLFTAVTGIKMFMETQNSLIVLGSLVIGALLGEWWRIEDGLQRLGELLEKRFNRSDDKSGRPAPYGDFVRGFMTASLLFCIGPIAILGSIQAGMSGDISLLVIKSVLDGFAAMAFASTLGVGVLFSAAMILIYQGAITLLAAQLNAIVSKPMMAELTATGGVLLLGIAISSLLEIKKIRVGNFLPALVLAPVIVWIVGLFQH